VTLFGSAFSSAKAIQSPREELAKPCPGRNCSGGPWFFIPTQSWYQPSRIPLEQGPPLARTTFFLSKHCLGDGPPVLCNFFLSAGCRWFRFFFFWKMGHEYQCEIHSYTCPMLFPLFLLSSIYRVVVLGRRTRFGLFCPPFLSVLPPLTLFKIVAAFPFFRFQGHSSFFSFPNFFFEFLSLMLSIPRTPLF